MRILSSAVLALSMSACAGTTTVSAGGYVPAEQYTYTGGSGDVSADVSIGMFQSELAPYGQWISASSYGSCWQPSQSVVGYEFEPYSTGGSWAWTDAGWQFESDLPFAWATFHYGRWLNDPGVGWCWAPGTEWAPSWVDWRFGEGFVGWAPLPPDNWAYRHRYQPQWVFVDAPHFVARDAWRYRMQDYHRAYNVTRPVARSGGARYVAGPPPQQVTQYIGRPVPTAPVSRGRPPPGGTRPWMRQNQGVTPAPAPTPVQPPASQPQPPPTRWNPTTPPERHRGEQPQARPQPPPAAPTPPPAQPPPAPPQWGHQHDQDRQPPRAMPQPPVATPPQAMPGAPPQPPGRGPPEGRGPPNVRGPLPTPPSPVPPQPPPQARPPPPEKRRGPPVKHDPDERRGEQRRQEP